MQQLRTQKLTNEGNTNVCEPLNVFFNKTQVEYSVLEDTLLASLKTSQNEQNSNLNRILQRQKEHIAKCATNAAADIMSELLEDINGKINGFEKEFEKIESLQKKLKPEANDIEKRQMELLNDVNANLKANQVKLENHENQLPKLLDLMKSLKQMSGKSVHKLPISFILGSEKFPFSEAE